MDFHGINMKGYFKAQSVVDASILSYSAEDEGKIVYDEVTEDIWLADNEDWKNSSQYIDTPLGTEMWFYQDSEPDGWSISGTGDTLLAIKGSALTTYKTGGAYYGAWATPAHAHVMNSHIHSVSSLSIGNASSTVGGRSGGGDVALWNHGHVFNVNVGGPAPPLTAIGGIMPNFRPKARVGLICERV